jgi:AraC-like DNA-binding protein
MAIVPEKKLSVFRAAHLITDIEFFRDIGTPVERELERARLPASVELDPEAAVSAEHFFRFRERCQAIEKIDNYGFELYEKNWGLKYMNPAFRLRMGGCHTLLDAIRATFETLRYENPKARYALRVSGDVCEIKLYTDEEFRPRQHVSITDWHRLLSITRLIRIFTVADWQPTRAHFQGDLKPNDRAREAFNRTTFTTGNSHTSIFFPADTLANSAPPGVLEALAASVGKSYLNAPWDFEDETGLLIPTLRRLLRPYLFDGRPDLALLAEMAGTSKRTLQRVLMRHGLTYSKLLDSCRFESARELLGDPGVKLIDVGMSVGFDIHANFTRAFQRHAGMSPSQFRKHLIAN